MCQNCSKLKVEADNILLEKTCLPCYERLMPLLGLVSPEEALAQAKAKTKASSKSSNDSSSSSSPTKDAAEAPASPAPSSGGGLTCKGCQADMPASAKFCPSCGTRV